MDYKLLSKINNYSSPENKKIIWINPSFNFYIKFIGVVIRSGNLARKKKYGAEEWVKSSIEILTALESSGVRFDIDGMDNISSFEGSAVFISNHMSTLETMILPSIIQPRKNVTFVVKQELLKVPYFGHVLGSRNPIIVGRSNAREDLVKVMEQGTDLIKKGTSIIIFPQRTRSKYLNSESFNSLGVKLARKAGCPVVPVALLTDAWNNGRIIKDIGKIDPSRTVHFSFGSPLKIESSGSNEHFQVLDYIKSKLTRWGRAEYIVK